MPVPWRGVARALLRALTCTLLAAVVLALAAFTRRRALSDVRDALTHFGDHHTR